jgi:hypothetical protein
VALEVSTSIFGTIARDGLKTSLLGDCVKKCQDSPAHPQMLYLPKEPTIPTSKKKNNRNRRRNKLSQVPEETIKMINAVNVESDHLLAPPFLTKKDDPRVPIIECTINQKIFCNTLCDIGSGANIMSNVTYEYFFW